MLDNYDSFTWNLVNLLEMAGAHEGLPVHVTVVRSDAETLAQLAARQPDAVVLSPGPCGPQAAGVCLALVQAWAGQVPILGVCLGLQVMAAAFGARVVRAPVPVHGKTDLALHDGRGLFAGLPDPLPIMRYHSLVVAEASLPLQFEVSARLQKTPHLIMGLRHREWPLEAVQFHPESVGTPQGAELARNAVRWMAARRARWNPDSA